ncbi:transmembrane protein 241 isoform X4 [Ailuropoda melanoleuca]|uniref:transmembrane protein 241 isoform X4 n=1 Tax=Ailuropoda melanoleuca TaxID=9646 RepID=UPI001494C24C|nr:transmembrane protein 241 isoform X4 [Ailuropoda melanoleuca]
MCVRRCLVGLTFCTCYLASYLTNKYVLSVLKFTYPTLFQGSDVSTWLPASVLFVGIIYAGSRALSKLAIPVFLTLHNVAEVILCGHQKCFRKEKTSPAKICSALFLLAAAGCLPFNDPQFDPGGYFWAVIHLFCVVYLVFSKNGEKRSRSLCQKHCPSAAYPKKWAYKILQKARKPNALSDIDQQYLNYTFRAGRNVCCCALSAGKTSSLLCCSICSVVLLALASHPTGDLFSVLDFPFLYFYRFHGSCCASGLLGFFLMLSTVKLKSLMAPGQCAAWIFFAKVITAGSSVLLFDTILTSATVGCLLLGGLGEALLVFSEQKGS